MLCAPTSHQHHKMICFGDLVKQNGLAKTRADPNYPITRNGRRQYREQERGIDPPARPLNGLIILQATVFLASIHDVQDEAEVEKIMSDTDDLIRSDSPTSDTVTVRWKSIIDGIDSSSELSKAICLSRERGKQKEGNTRACGLTNGEKTLNDDEFELIMKLPLGTPFVVRSGDHVDQMSRPLIDEGVTIPVFSQFTFGGLRERVVDRPALQDNTNHYRSIRSSVPLTLKHTLGKNDMNQCFRTEDGEHEDGFVMAHLSEPRDAKTLKQQFEDIKALPLGTHFWLRKNNKTSSSDTPEPHNPAKCQCFNVPTWISTRDHLNKVDLCPTKVGAQSGEWFLCKLTVKKRRAR